MCKGVLIILITGVFLSGCCYEAYSRPFILAKRPEEGRTLFSPKDP